MSFAPRKDTPMSQRIDARCILPRKETACVWDCHGHRPGKSPYYSDTAKPIVRMYNIRRRSSQTRILGADHCVRTIQLFWTPTCNVLPYSPVPTNWHTMGGQQVVDSARKPRIKSDPVTQTKVTNWPINFSGSLLWSDQLENSNNANRHGLLQHSVAISSEIL